MKESDSRMEKELQFLLHMNQKRILAMASNQAQTLSFKSLALDNLKLNTLKPINLILKLRLHFLLFS